MYFIDLVGFFPFLSQKEIYTSFFFTFIPKFRKLESNIFTDRKESFRQINIIFLSSPFFCIISICIVVLSRPALRLICLRFNIDQSLKAKQTRRRLSILDRHV